MSGRRNEGDTAGLTALAMRLERDFNVLVERGQHPHQFLDRYQPQLPAKQFDRSGCLSSISLAAAVWVGPRSAINRFNYTTNAALS
jgi:hypothetical protein